MTKNQKSKTKWKNKVLSLVSGSKRDGIFKPNTATQLTVITIINWNSKVDPQNKVKQEGLPQLKNIFQFLHLNWNKPWTKVLENQKKVCQGRSHLVYYQARPYPNYEFVYIMCNINPCQINLINLPENILF